MRFQNTYKFSWTILVLIALMAQSFKFNFVIADYYVNTANYIKNCINKSKPQSTCQGKCQMMKKMREEQQKEEQSSGNRAENKFEQVVYINTNGNFLTAPLIASTNNFPPFLEGKLLDFIASPFQPPGV
ncbi:MAG: hypothetical protein KGP35_06050 [Bacteroidetes bacterium]|nr:hypothetical protein [Bacteroidota bacterium]